MVKFTVLLMLFALLTIAQSCDYTNGIPDAASVCQHHDNVWNMCDSNIHWWTEFACGAFCHCPDISSNPQPEPEGPTVENQFWTLSGQQGGENSWPCLGCRVIPHCTRCGERQGCIQCETGYQPVQCPFYPAREGQYAQSNLNVYVCSSQTLQNLGIEDRCAAWWEKYEYECPAGPGGKPKRPDSFWSDGFLNRPTGDEQNCESTFCPSWPANLEVHGPSICDFYDVLNGFPGVSHTDSADWPAEQTGSNPQTAWPVNEYNPKCKLAHQNGCDQCKYSEFGVVPPPTMEPTMSPTSRPTTSMPTLAPVTSNPSQSPVTSMPTMEPTSKNTEVPPCERNHFAEFSQSADVYFTEDKQTTKWQYENDQIQDGEDLSSYTLTSIGNHQLVPGSIQTPVWADYSINGNQISLSGEKNVMKTKLNIVAELAMQVHGGDGFVPILTKDRSRLYLNFHHSQAANNLYCHDVQNNVKCNNNYPRKTPMGANGKSSWVSYNGGSLNYNDNIYINAYDATEWGITCWDMKADTQCGYIKLGPNPNYNFRAATIARGSHWISNIGNKIYSFDMQMQLHCATADLQPCGGNYPMDFQQQFGFPSLAGINFRETKTEVSGTKLFLFVPASSSSRPTTGAERDHIICIDTSFNGFCNGWVTNPQTFNRADGENLFFSYDTNGQQTGVCTGWNQPGIAAGQKLFSCVDINTGEINDGLINNVMFGGNHGNGWSYNQVAHTVNSHGDAISVFSHISNHHYSQVYNWTSNTEKKIYPENGAVVYPYGSVVDSAGCIWVGGDANNLFQYDPETDEIGCSSASASLHAVKNSCCSECCTDNSKWSRVTIPHDFDAFEKLTLTISHENVVVETVDFKSITSFDITGLKFQQFDTLDFKVSGLPSGSLQNEIEMEVHTEDADFEICFDTEAFGGHCENVNNQQKSNTIDVEMVESITLGPVYSVPVNSNCFDL